MPKPPDTDARPLLFCPFCRECFEGEKECPEHELALVPFDALPRDPEVDAGDLPAHDQAVSLLDPRFGRGLVMAGVVVSAVGFLMPVLAIETDSRMRLFTGFEAASTNAPNLWTVPFVAAMFVWVLMRRRTPIAMLGARLAGVVFAIAPLLSLAYTVLKVRQGAAQFAERTHHAMDVGVEYGVAVIAVGGLLLLIGSLRLGVLPIPKGHHLSSPDPDVRSPVEPPARRRRRR
ncbi:MAG: hypothetical protein M3Y87_28200 [Myxococcota bacterium]|nr:hypothetical protein [Myxococcota bacterium]